MDLAYETDTDGFEIVDTEDIAKEIAKEKKPDLEKINKWLTPTDYRALTSEFSRHLSSQAPGTGEWIRFTVQFSQWHSSPDHGSIWIKAVPGAGKSVIAASMVDSLTRNESVPVLFFFFRNIIETNRSSRFLLKDWISQLLPYSQILQISLWDLVEDEKDLEEISNAKLWKYLLTGLQTVDRAYCIVDALDEMNLEEDFLAQLNSLGSFRPSHVKVLLTSRPKQYLQRALKDPSVIHVSLEEELVQRDIVTFVKHRVNSFENEQLSSATKQFIIETVCKRSEGLFLYARLMLDEISQTVKKNPHNDIQLRNMISRLPIGLEEMYNRILYETSISTGIASSIQLSILEFVTHAARPMRLIEISKAIEHDPNVKTFEKDSKYIVRNACGPLLEIVENEVVQILHHSFTEFLLDVGRMNQPEAQYQFPTIDPTKAHRNIALSCLAELQSAYSVTEKEQANHSKGSKDEETTGRRRADSMEKFRIGQQRNTGDRSTYLKFPFTRYAMDWTYHAKLYDIEDDDWLNSLERFCQPGSAPFDQWLQNSPALIDVDRTIYKAAQLHIAAGFGLTAWVKRLITKNLDLDVTDSNGSPPLVSLLVY
jgi:hypothetical protein